MKVWEMPWFERPGVRLKRYGTEVLSDAELLAIVLGRGSIEKTNRIFIFMKKIRRTKDSPWFGDVVMRNNFLLRKDRPFSRRVECEEPDSAGDVGVGRNPLKKIN